jgi:hypothetical protein
LLDILSELKMEAMSVENFGLIFQKTELFRAIAV